MEKWQGDKDLRKKVGEERKKCGTKRKNPLSRTRTRFLNCHFATRDARTPPHTAHATSGAGAEELSRPTVSPLNRTCWYNMCTLYFGELRHILTSLCQAGSVGFVCRAAILFPSCICTFGKMPRCSEDLEEHTRTGFWQDA